MQRSRGIPLMTVVVAVALIGAVALWYRAGPRGAGSAVSTGAIPHGSAVGGGDTPRPFAPAPSPLVEGSAPAPASVPATDAVPAGDADQRQLAKITRGMAAAAGGGILVTATPPGSVTGQLRLHAGDVIVAINGEAIPSPEGFARIYQEQGLPREITIIRDGREIHRH